MKISEHADRTEQLYGIRGEDIHRWIDGFFDYNGEEHNGTMAREVEYDPYSHRRFRHCKEALAEAIKEFGDCYTSSEIRNVFETHIRDDYHGYLPTRTDFENGSFTAKYHDTCHEAELGEVLDESELADYFSGLNAVHSDQQSPFNRFGLRIVLPTVSAIVLFVTAIFYLILPLVEKSMVDQKQLMLKELTSSAVSVVDSYIQLEQSGALSMQEAQEQAAEKIKTMRYGPQNKDYFFITDMHPRMIMHPYRGDLTNQDLTHRFENENSDDYPIFVEIVKLVKRSHEGYLEYLWQWKDDETITAPKMTYVEGVEEWQWIVGTGVYLEDVQQEIDRLESTLYRVFVAITVGLALILFYVMAQSKGIERRKLRAEMALHEAKNRYKALVESSNEGYILEADGKIVFSNTRLHQLLGYTDTELKSKTIWQDLFSSAAQNSQVLEHLLQLFQHEAEPAEFEAQIVTKSGREIDIILSTSRIFLSEKLGHVISFRPIVRKVYGGSFSSTSPSGNYHKTGASIVSDIETGDSHSHVIESLNRLTDLIREMIASGSRPDHLRQLIGSTYDAAICRFIELTIEEIGEPPVPFSFLSFGSNARHDMTLFSDQDNAIVFETPDDQDLKATRRYFLHLAEKVCAMLNQAGYRYCEGLIMASNHQWCLSEKEWQANFTRWVEDASPDTILELNVFFDIRSTFGDVRLADGIQAHIQSLLEKQPDFLVTYAQNCLAHTVPLDSAGELVTEQHEGREVINLKDCLRPMEIFCRLYALKLDIRESNSIQRLKAILAAQEIDTKTYREMVYIFDHIWQLRFMNQIIEYSDLRLINDMLTVSELTILEQQNFKNVLQRVSMFHDKVQQDFRL
ncbi:chemotaxis protein [Vibrio tubiashii]|nr:chemotaxis protein [Vibrio tubiashii]